MDGLLKFFSFELYYSSFHLLTIKSSYRVDRSLINFPFNSFEILQFVIICFGHKDKLYKKEIMLKVLVQVHQTFKTS